MTPGCGRSGSLESQRRQWIDAGRAPRRYTNSYERYGNHDQRNGHKAGGVEWTDLKERGGEQTGRSRGSGNADCATRQDQADATAQDHPENLALRGAEREADADLFSTLRYGVTKDAVDAHSRER